MKRGFRRNNKKVNFFICLIFLSCILTLSIFVTGQDNGEDINAKLTAVKKTIKDEQNVGKYNVNINVAGNEKIIESEEKLGYNVIFVMDGSTSTGGSEWKAMRNSLINLINDLLPYDDPSKNINKAGLITFGIDYHINIELTNDRNIFESVIPGESGGNLLDPGRSSTNIEVGVKGAREYLKSIKGTDLEKDDTHTIVVLMTDGEVNMSEVPFNFYDPNSTTLYDVLDEEGALTKRKNTYIESRKDYYVKILEEIQSNDEYVVDNFYTGQIESINFLYDSIKDDGENVTLENKVKAIKNNEQTKEETEKLLNDGIAKIYSLINYTEDMEMSAGEYERAFIGKNLLGYEKLNDILYDTYLQTLFYLVYAPKYYHAQRAIDEGNLLDESATIYTIGYGINNSRKDAFKILDPNFEGSGNYTANVGTKHFSTEFNKASTDTLEVVLNDLFDKILIVKYKDVEIVDYTSKWVNPIDSNGDGIFDENDITVTNNGQKITADVKVEKLNPEEVKLLDNIEIIGNTNGDIYKIIWNIPGYIYSWDKYELTYGVKVDNQEDGFISENEYNANAAEDVTLTYDVIQRITDENGNEIENIVEEGASGIVEIIDPVAQKENVIIVTRTDEQGNFLSGTDFEITSENGDKKIIKEYSKDGIHFTKDNIEGEILYIRFSGLYDFDYTLTEIKKEEDGYVTSDEIKLDFTKDEGNIKDITVINKHKIGSVVIHYVVKVGNEYISFKDYAYDSNGILNLAFKDVNINDVTLTGNIGENFETFYNDVEGFKFIGLYDKNSGKLEQNKIKGKFTEQIQEFTYVFELEQSEEQSPQTGDNFINYICILLLSLIGIALVKEKVNE